MSPTRPRSLLPTAVCAALFALVVAPSSASAFSFAEHFRLGQDAYQHACYLLRKNLPKKSGLGDEEARIARLEMACPANEGLLDDLARVFGQAVALSGDHVGSPAGPGTVDGLRAALSLANYAGLGLQNSLHFHPSGRAEWSRNHNRALELAHETPEESEARSRFEEMLRSLAFGDHFLQDAFAAGHMGFNRPSSAPVASMLYHDLYSRAGRVVASNRTSANGRDQWVTYGDYHLCESAQSQPTRCTRASFKSMFDFAACMCVKFCPKHPEGHADAHLHVHAAATTSVLDVLYAFVTKERSVPLTVRDWTDVADDLEDAKRIDAHRRKWTAPAPGSTRKDDIALVADLLVIPAHEQIPTAYCTDSDARRNESKKCEKCDTCVEHDKRRVCKRCKKECDQDGYVGCRVRNNECPNELPEKRQFIALSAVPTRAYVAFAPVIEMRWGTGLAGNQDYGFWMPSLGFKFWHAEVTAAYATPPPFREPRFWRRDWSSLYLRGVLETPAINVYRTPVSLSMLGGFLAEVCLQNCVSHAPGDDRLLGFTLGPRLSLEALSAIIGVALEPFLLWNKDAQVTFGLTLALSVAKPIMGRGLIRGGGRYSGPD